MALGVGVTDALILRQEYPLSRALWVTKPVSDLCIYTIPLFRICQALFSSFVKHYLHLYDLYSVVQKIIKIMPQNAGISKPHFDG
jgi:hypothetical protein